MNLLTLSLISLMAVGCSSKEPEGRIAAKKLITPDEQATVSVQHFDGSDTTWTILVYMCGSDLESYNASATEDLYEMMDADLLDRINVLVEAGGAYEWQNDFCDPSYLTRIRIDGENSEVVMQEETANMGDQSVFTDFVKWGIQEYPADRYGLIFWDHGGGPLSGVCFDENYGFESLSLDEISGGLKEVDEPFAFIGFDACNMACLETAYVLAPFANYMIASEETEPGNGWDYAKWLDYLSRENNCKTEDLAKEILQTYHSSYDDSDSITKNTITLSVTDLTRINPITEGFHDLAQKMFESTADYDELTEVQLAARKTQVFGSGSMNLVDLGDLANNMEPLYEEESQRVMQALNDAIVYQIHGRYRRDSAGLAVTYPGEMDADEIALWYETMPENDAYINYMSYVTGSQDSLYGEIGEAWTDTEIDWIDPESADEITWYLNVDQDSNVLELVLTGGEDSLLDVYFSLMYLPDDSDYLVWLGSDFDMDWEENNIFRSRFKGRWACIDGNPICIEYIGDYDDYAAYYIPVEVNGQSGSLLAYYDYETDSYMLDQMVTLDDANGTNVWLQEGDDIAFIGTAIDLSDENATAGEYDLYEREWSNLMGLEDIEMAAGTFGYMFEIEDIFGNVYDTDVITYEWDGEEAVLAGNAVG